jgi:ankyrin repeat protein
MAAAKDERLIRAARAGDLHQVEALLAAGAVVDETDSAGTTALMFAAQKLCSACWQAERRLIGLKGALG